MEKNIVDKDVIHKMNECCAALYAITITQFSGVQVDHDEGTNSGALAEKPDVAEGTGKNSCPVARSPTTEARSQLRHSLVESIPSEPCFVPLHIVIESVSFPSRKSYSLRTQALGKESVQISPVIVFQVRLEVKHPASKFGT